MSIRAIKVVGAALVVLGVLESPASADSVGGRITRTFIIVEDTDLVGDVTCDTGGSPCFAFGAPDVELRLNGFAITGPGDPVTACGGAVFPNEFGITTAGQPRVVVRGPGLVQRFRNHGVIVGASRDVRVEQLTASTNCGSGVFINATSFGTLVQGVVSVRNGASAPNLSCGGI